MSRESGSGSEDPRDWFLTNEMKAETRADVNRKAGAKRMFSHAIFTPGTPGWLEKVDKEYETNKPDSFKGYTVGDNTNNKLSKHPWRLDDAKLLYPFYERLAKWSKTTPSLANVCIHKGLYSAVDGKMASSQVTPFFCLRVSPLSRRERGRG